MLFHVIFDNILSCFIFFPRFSIFNFFILSAGSSLLDCADAFVFHSPFCKLVQKSVARIMFNDFLQDPHPEQRQIFTGLDAFRLVNICVF
jgi:3-hydroxy-3-methylglutaryl CoA synthase